MKKKILLFLFAVWACQWGFSQNADPTITAGSYTPTQITVGQTANLKMSFSNAGTTDIPAGSIEITITTSETYYKSDGTTAPSGTGATLFN